MDCVHSPPVSPFFLCIILSETLSVARLAVIHTHQEKKQNKKPIATLKIQDKQTYCGHIKMNLSSPSR